MARTMIPKGSTMEKPKEAIARRIRERLGAVLGGERPPLPDESRAQGKALRRQVPRAAHAAWEPQADRPDPVQLLRSQEAARVAELVPIRYERMSESAFAFYRGSALIMASDLSTTPTTGINVQVCGDAHISNFGLFNSPERRTVFDINDFDETTVGPWEWDVKRLAASVEICGRENGLGAKQRKDAVSACVAGYHEAMRRFAEMGNLEVWYAHVDADELQSKIRPHVSKKTAHQAGKVIAKAKAKDSARAVAKLTEVVDGELRIVYDPPLIVPLRKIMEGNGGLASEEVGGVDMADLVNKILFEYRATLPPDKRQLIDQYTGVDVARKVVGVGSVGTRAWIIVMRGASDSDPLVLQVKEAQESVLERFVGKSRYRERGRRVVEGQRAMQSASDLLLGWCHLPGDKGVHHYYVRQLWDGKGSIDLARIDATQLAALARACGYTLAHAHARTGDRFAIAGYLGKNDEFDKAIGKFAIAYADQNEADYARFMQAYENGGLPRS